MKATIHYDTGDTSEASAIVSKISKILHYLEFIYKGKNYILGKHKLAEHGIVRITQNSGGKILWSLNPKRRKRRKQ